MLPTCSARYEPTYKGLKLSCVQMRLSRSFSYEPTYKGLKHVTCICSTGMTITCYEPTYKGLKRIRLLASMPTAHGYEPTYKGLKLGCTSCERPSANALRAYL